MQLQLCAVHKCTLPNIRKYALCNCTEDQLTHTASGKILHYLLQRSQALVLPKKTPAMHCPAYKDEIMRIEPCSEYNRTIMQLCNTMYEPDNMFLQRCYVYAIAVAHR